MQIYSILIHITKFETSALKIARIIYVSVEFQVFFADCIVVVHETQCSSKTKIADNCCLIKWLMEKGVLKLGHHPEVEHDLKEDRRKA